MLHKLNQLLLVALLTIVMFSCNSSDNGIVAKENSGNNTFQQENDYNKSDAIQAGFVHGIIVSYENEDYYFSGPADGPNGERDIPGHYWVQTGPNQLIGKHYNEGPFGASQWWSSDADNGELLYIVKAVIDEWTKEKAKMYYNKGFVHYHELVSVDSGEEHPTDVVWLKHIARTIFTLDGGPGAPNPPYEHYVTPGVDTEFPNNGLSPYNP